MKKFLAFFVMLLLIGFSLAAYAMCPNGLRAIIVGYHHEYDVVPQQFCDQYGCRLIPTRIPCQHPIWQCR